MAKGIHKGTELHNVSETWDQNERERENRDASSGKEGTTADAAGSEGSALDQLIKEEASEYDNTNKENRILSGERATINDDPGDTASNE